MEELFATKPMVVEIHDRDLLPDEPDGGGGAAAESRDAAEQQRALEGIYAAPELCLPAWERFTSAPRALPNWLESGVVRAIAHGLNDSGGP